jgi:hypothetical protein
MKDMPALKGEREIAILIRVLCMRRRKIEELSEEERGSCCLTRKIIIQMMV